MKQPKAEAQRWLAQSHHDLTVAKSNLKNGFFADACFMAEQTAQKALKGYLYGQGQRHVWQHSIRLLLIKSSQKNPAFNKLQQSGSTLDQYYIAARYPDAIAPPGVPFETYTKQDANQAINIATKILITVQKHL